VKSLLERKVLGEVRCIREEMHELNRTLNRLVEVWSAADSRGAGGQSLRR